VLVELTSATQHYSVSVDLLDAVGRLVRSVGSHELRPQQREAIHVEMDGLSHGRLFLRLVDPSRNLMLILPLMK
jgi:hypothetical protein